jgi:hypothetical protein
VSKTASELWPALPYEEWKDTYATLHMWTQIVGKIALASVPPLNHSWAIALRVTPRGLSTRRLFHGSRSFAMEFDFIDHDLVIQTSDGSERRLRLEARTVAEFYQEVMALLREMGLAVTIWTMPVEIASPIRFDRDTIHRSYDPLLANRFWRILGQIDHVFTRGQSAFIGKSSPSHFFWGSFDLAVTRFSGRPAPPRDGPAFMREAYSHELVSHGFWPGSAPVLEPAFYAYAVPEPPRFKDLQVQPDAAFYHRELGEFILPYESVRTAQSPEATLSAFIESTYEGAADLAGWDRKALERPLVVSHRT